MLVSWRIQVIMIIWSICRRDLPYFDLIVCNLYPFKQENTENIDIGGVSLIRAGSKNFTMVVLSHQYSYFMENFNGEDKELLGINIETRSSLATKGFTTRL